MVKAFDFSVLHVNTRNLVAHNSSIHSIIDHFMVY